MTDNIFFFTTFKNDIRFFYDSLTVREGMDVMKACRFTVVPVLDQQGHYIGSVSEGDFLWYMDEHNSQSVLDSVLIEELVRPGFMPAVDISVDFDILLDASLHQNYVPVVDDRNIFIGIVTRQAIISYFIKTLADSSGQQD
ncbi:MAG: CBS domain-containing protein [Erysipelotrichaceae bacterium]|nr:CBS domain-containing protein [Erysipelotrichaceae bacterium]